MRKRLYVLFLCAKHLSLTPFRVWYAASKLSNSKHLLPVFPKVLILTKDKNALNEQYVVGCITSRGLFKIELFRVDIPEGEEENITPGCVKSLWPATIEDEELSIPVLTDEYMNQLNIVHELTDHTVTAEQYYKKLTLLKLKLERKRDALLTIFS